mgnify:CR=1 FL=1
MHILSSVLQLREVLLNVSMYSMYVVIAYCFHCIYLYPFNVKKKLLFLNR